MPDEKSTSPCRGTSAKPSPASNTPPRQSDRTSHIPTSSQITEQRNNIHKKKMTHQPSARRGKKLSKKYVACSFSSRGQSTGAYSPLSALLHPNRQNQRREQWSYARNSSTSCHAKKKPYSPTERATWSSQSTATRRTSPSQNHAAAPEATCSWQEKMKSPSTTGLSSTSRK